MLNLTFYNSYNKFYSKEKIKEIVSWLEKQPVNSIERQTCGTLILESDVVKKIEETIEDNKTNKICKHYTMQIKPHLLFKVV